MVDEELVPHMGFQSNPVWTILTMLAQNRLRQFLGPVYFALGSLTAISFEHAAQTLAGLFPDFHLEAYATTAK